MAHVRALDVSRHQGWINWPVVARDSGAAGVWIKVGGADGPNGGLYRDGRSAENLGGAERAGFPYGTYYFANPKVGDALRQARHALNDCNLGAGQLWPTLDLEWHNDLTGAQLDQFALEFINEVRTTIGRPVIVYTGAYIGKSATGYFGTHRDLAKSPLWIANYGTNAPGTTPPNFNPPVPAAWAGTGWSIWQFNSSTTVPGITQNVCDQNVVQETFWAQMSGTEIDFEEWRMRPIIVSGEQQQWRLVDDGNGVLRRQAVDSLELLAILNHAELLTDQYVTLTDRAQIERFRQIPEVGQTASEWTLIQVASNVVKAVQTAIAEDTEAAVVDVDEDALADRLVHHFAQHLAE